MAYFAWNMDEGLHFFYPVSMAGWMGTLKKKLKKVASRKTATRVAMAIADLIVFALVGVWRWFGYKLSGMGLI